MTKDETKQNVEFVIPLVNDILQYVHERDRRFKIQPLNVGSYYSHLKVSRADEFDYSVVLDVGSSLAWSTGKPACCGYNENKEVVRTSISLPSPAAGKCFTQMAELIQKWNNEQFGWPRLGAKWPSWIKMKEIESEGIHEVAKDPFYWSVSFVTCEKKMLDGIDLNGTCRKKVIE
ncbi:unnamed protein product [Mytilus coruscus]|uniref:Mab-21-like nucleotidyltransferase domain-containing protein n=1 Tax=Mytilus coruscus TaxID=42192 RepID=A0A6J8CPN7_MYTCO|nr:unnamed protein product [Mytilus coruscus]